MKSDLETLQEKLESLWFEIEDLVFQYARKYGMDFYETVDKRDLSGIREGLEEIGSSAADWAPSGEYHSPDGKYYRDRV